jgi:hypothetical protein
MLLCCTIGFVFARVYNLLLVIVTSVAASGKVSSSVLDHSTTACWSTFAHSAAALSAQEKDCWSYYPEHSPCRGLYFRKKKLFLDKKQKHWWHLGPYMTVYDALAQLPAPSNPEMATCFKADAGNYQSTSCEV